MSLDQFFIVPFPSRIQASGNQLLNPFIAVNFPGTVGRMTRRQIIVTNLSPTADLQIRLPNGVECMTVFPRVALTIETGNDLQLYNNTGSVIQYQVCELFFDEGTMLGGGGRNAKAAARDGGGGGSTGSATMLGGGLGGGHQTYTP